MSDAQKKAPDLKVGVTTAAPTESPSPVVAAALHQALAHAFEPDPAVFASLLGVYLTWVEAGPNGTSGAAGTRNSGSQSVCATPEMIAFSSTGSSSSTIHARAM